MDKKPLSRTAKYYRRVPIAKRHGGNFDIYELISKYRDYECIWNYNCKEYKNKRLKERSWLRIAKYFNTDVSMVKTKMKHLRSAYVGEKKKVKKALMAGDSTYTPNLFYYKYLSFLDDIVVLRNDLEKTNDLEYITNDVSQDTEEQDESESFIKTEYNMEPAQQEYKSTQLENIIDVAELISKYKDNRCLWDYSCEDYKNLSMRQEAWESISNYFGFEVSDIKGKMKNLRSAYVAEKKKVDMSKQKGISRTPILFYYKNFSFLDNIVVWRKVPEKIGISNDYKRSSASEFDSDEKDEVNEFEPLIKLEHNSLATLPAAKRHNGHIDVYEIIAKYKHYECLWNIHNKNYKNLKLKEKCWRSIARHFDTEVSVVKSKVKNLRSAYLMEKKKVDKSKMLGERPHKPNLFYYQKLTFLDDVVVLRKAADELVLNKTNASEQIIDFESTNDFESKNNFDENNVYEFENVNISPDCEQNDEIEHLTKREDVELELPTIQEHSPSPSPTPSSEISIPKKLSTRSSNSRQPNKRKSKRKAKLHKAISDIERVDVYKSFGKTIALQLKQLSLHVASITMLEVHSILTKKVLEHYKSSHSDDDNQSTYSNEEECVDDIIQGALNDANL